MAMKAMNHLLVSCGHESMRLFVTCLALGYPKIWVLMALAMNQKSVWASSTGYGSKTRSPMVPKNRMVDCHQWCFPKWMLKALVSLSTTSKITNQVDLGSILF